MITIKQQEKIDSLKKEIEEGKMKLLGIKEDGKKVLVHITWDGIVSPLKSIVVAIGPRGRTVYNYLMENDKYVF
jgi:hypothetical protein